MAGNAAEWAHTRYQREWEAHADLKGALLDAQGERWGVVGGSFFDCSERPFHEIGTFGMNFGPCDFHGFRICRSATNP